MAADSEMTEEYLADLLKKDAAKVSSSYARHGTYDATAKRPVGKGLKPNTNFLQKIIKSTDNHNAAMKQRELADATRRLRDLAQEEDSSRKSKHDRRDRTYDRERHYARKRKREDNEPLRRNTSSPEPERPERAHRRRERSRDGSKSPRGNKIDRYKPGRSSTRRSRNRDRSESTRRNGTDRYRPREFDSTRSRSHSVTSTGSQIDSYRPSNRNRDSNRKQHRSKSHSAPPEGDSTDKDRISHQDRIPSSEGVNQEREERRHHRRSRRDSIHRYQPKHHRNREASLDHKNSRGKANEARRSVKSDHSENDPPNQHDSDLRSSKHSRRRHRSRSSSPKPLLKSRTPSPESEQQSVDKEQDASDDDPLSAFLGPSAPSPEPATQIRGRGATTYNKTDLTNSIPDPSSIPDSEDWDLALEALRDRQKFQAASAARYLEAGFSKEQVDRMKKAVSGKELDESDVVWKRKGQAREWDMGKVLDGDGDVVVSSVVSSVPGKRDENYGRLI